MKSFHHRKGASKKDAIFPHLVSSKRCLNFDCRRIKLGICLYKNIVWNERIRELGFVEIRQGIDRVSGIVLRSCRYKDRLSCGSSKNNAA